MDLLKPLEPSSALVSIRATVSDGLRCEKEDRRTIAESISTGAQARVDGTIRADELRLLLGDQSLASILDSDELLANGEALARVEGKGLQDLDALRAVDDLWKTGSA